MDLAAAFPDTGPFGGAGSMYYEGPPQDQRPPQGGGQATFTGALPAPPPAEQPVVYSANAPPQLPQLGGRQGFVDMGDDHRGSRGGRSSLQFKKAAYLALCFLLALSLHHVISHYLAAYLESGGFDTTRETLTRVLYPLLIAVAIWFVLRN